jgi:hypothetical protein
MGLPAAEGLGPGTAEDDQLQGDILTRDKGRLPAIISNVNFFGGKSAHVEFPSYMAGKNFIQDDGSFLN